MLFGWSVSPVCRTAGIFSSTGLSAAVDLCSHSGRILCCGWIKKKLATLERRKRESGNCRQIAENSRAELPRAQDPSEFCSQTRLKFIGLISRRLSPSDICHCLSRISQTTVSVSEELMCSSWNLLILQFQLWVLPTLLYLLSLLSLSLSHDFF